MNSELDLRVLFAPAFALWISGLIFKIKTPHFVRRTENLSKDGLSDKTDQDPDPLHENDFQSKERPLGTSQEQTAPSIDAKSLNWSWVNLATIWTLSNGRIFCPVARFTHDQIFCLEILITQFTLAPDLAQILRISHYNRKSCICNLRWFRWKSVDSSWKFRNTSEKLAIQMWISGFPTSRGYNFTWSADRS